MTKIEAAEILMKRDVAGFEQLLSSGGYKHYKELLHRLPLYIFNTDLEFADAALDMEIDVSMEGIIGFMTTMYLQTEGDCLFGIQNHPDGSGDGLLHGFFYVSKEA